MIYHRAPNKSNTTRVTSATGASYISSLPSFSGIRVARSLDFC